MECVFLVIILNIACAFCHHSEERKKKLEIRETLCLLIQIALYTQFRCIHSVGNSCSKKKKKKTEQVKEKHSDI